MAFTTRAVTVGFPPDDPTLALTGTLFVPDSALFPPPWNCIVGTVSGGYLQDFNLGPLILPPPHGQGIFQDLCNAGFMCLAHFIRLAPTIPGQRGGPLPGQTTSGTYPQQSNDLKMGIRALRSNPFGFGYNVTGWVGVIGGSASADHAIFCTLDGTAGDDRADAGCAFSAPTDYSDRNTDVTTQFIQWTKNYVYGDSTIPDSPTVLAHLLAVSPVTLIAAYLGVDPRILHYNGFHEPMPLTQQSGFATALAGAGKDSNYEQHTNTGGSQGVHSFAQWSIPGIGGPSGRVIAWFLEQIAPPPPGKLHTPTFTPAASDTSSTDTVIACIDSGSHLFYTLADDPPGPVDPVHVNDVPTAPTVRIASNTGTVNSGAGVRRFKCVAFKPGSTDSDIAVSGVFGAVAPPPGLKPILAGLGQLLPADKPDSWPTDLPTWGCWTKPWIDFVRYRGVWQTSNPAPGVYDFSHLDDTIALCIANNKFLSFNFSSGLLSPQWVYDGGATRYIVHDPGATDDETFTDGIINGTNVISSATAKFETARDVGCTIQCPGVPNGTTILSVTDATHAVMSNAATQSGGGRTFTIQARLGVTILPWDPNYQTPWFTFMNAVAAHIAGLDCVRAMIDCGFMLSAGLSMGDTVDEANMPFLPFGYADIHMAYRAAATHIMDFQFSLFPNIGHAITYEKVWPDDSRHKDAQFVRDYFIGTYSPRAGTIITSLRATLAPHPGSDPANLVAYPRYGQQFRNMTQPQGANHYTPQPDPSPLPDPLTCLQDCLLNADDVDMQYVEVYKVDVEFVGADATFEICRDLLIANLLPPDVIPPPQCPPGQHWDPKLLKCVPDPLPGVNFVLKRIIENGKLTTDLDCQNRALINVNLFTPAPDNLVDTSDPRMSDARIPQLGSITNESVNAAAAIDQSKLDFSQGHIPSGWLGTDPGDAASGNHAEFLSNKNQPNGYVGLDSNGKFDISLLPSTGPQSGTVTYVAIVLPFPELATNQAITNSGNITAAWQNVPDKSYFGVNGGVGLDMQLKPSFLTGPIPDSIVPSLDASKIGSGVIPFAMLPIAVGFGVSHSVGIVPDTGLVTASGFANDYLGRDMLWHAFVDPGTIQPKAPTPIIAVLSYSGSAVNASIQISTTLNGGSMFYALGTNPFKQQASPFNIKVSVGTKVTAYVARPGYNNSDLATFVVPPKP